MPHHTGLPLLLALAAVACAGKSVDLDGSGLTGNEAGGAGGAGVAVTLVTADEGCYAIAVDSQRLYWLAQPDGKPSVLRSCLKDDCAKTHLTYPTNATDVAREARLIKVQAGTVYWLGYQDLPATGGGPALGTSEISQSIWACAATGCSEPQLIVAEAGEGGFEIDSDEIYYASRSGSGLMACPISGCAGAPRALPEWGGHEPPGLSNAFIANFPIATGDSLFWVSESGQLIRLRKDGSSPPESLATGLELVTALAANESHVYWPVSLLAGSIGRCSYPACAGGLQPFVPSVRRPQRLVVGGDALFFQQQLATGDWQIASCSFDGCAEPHRIAALRVDGVPMAVDEAWVYVVSFDATQRMSIGRIHQ